MVEYSDNVGIAFAVVIGAGLSTAVGASVVFFPSLIQYANRKTLASGLGLSAGVMTYVSFVEIFQKSVDSFVEADFLDHQAYFSATLCFFAGIILMICLNLCIHGVVSGNLITKGQYGPEDDDSDSDDSDSSDSSVSDRFDEFVDDPSGTMKENSNHHYLVNEATKLPEPCCANDVDPVERLADIHDMAQSMELRTMREEEEEEAKKAAAADAVSNNTVVDMTDSDLEAGLSNHNNNNKQSTTKSINSINKKKVGPTDNKSIASSTTKQKKKKSKEPSAKDKHRLRMMSLNTAMAIALHNFPEGLATFVATLQDPAVGVILAVAIAIHNIPEGLCVAMPVYYATGDRWRAFTWGLVSGVSEPLAALMGWIVLASWINDIVYAVLFGVVAGMMVVISIKELIPTAHRYDPQDTCVSTMFIVGMAIMAASLVLFSHL